MEDNLDAPFAGYLITDNGAFVDFILPGEDDEALALYRNCEYLAVAKVATRTSC